MMTVYVYGCCSIIAGAVSFGIYNLFFAAKNIIHEPEPHYVYLAPKVVDESVPDMWNFQNPANDQNSEEDIGLCLNLYFDYEHNPSIEVSPSVFNNYDEWFDAVLKKNDESEDVSIK